MEFISLLIHCSVFSSVTIEFILVSYEKEREKRTILGIFLRSSLNRKIKAIKERRKPVHFYYFLLLWFNRNVRLKYR